MSLVRLSLVGAFVVSATSAFCTISTTGPFSGALHESFDEFPDQGQELFLPNPTPSFGNHGIITTSGPFPALAVYNPPDHPFGNYVAHDGDFFAVTQSTGDSFRIDMDQQMTDFGGWFGLDAIHVEFYDASGASVGGGDYETDFNVDGNLQWLGWHSTVAFSSVDVSSQTSVIFDSLEADVVPEPVSIVAMGLGLAALLRKKRTH